MEYDPHDDAVKAWRICASLHRAFCKETDPFFTTRQQDFKNHVKTAEQERKKARDLRRSKKR